MGKTTMKIQTDLREARCPSCGTWINTAGLTRRRKVQCPKCREVVDLSTCELSPARVEAIETAPVSSDAMAAELGELRERVGRLEQLEARIAELESALAKALSGDPAVRRTAAAPGKLKWMPHADAFADAGFTEEAASILVHNLSAVRPHTIAIRSAAGDPAAKDRALCFKDIFERGAWTVRGPWDTHAPIGERGLILAVRSFPVPAEVTAAFIALTASGFSVISRLDPHLESDEAMLIVA